MHGWVIGDFASLYLQRGRNSWRSQLYLRLKSNAGGTDVHCRAYMSRVIIVFQVIFFGALIVQSWPNGWLATVVTLMFSAGFWSVFIVLGLYLSRREPTELRAIVCNVLDATPVTPLPPPSED